LHADLTVRRLVENVSTNLDNLRTDPIAVLVASAFVVSPLSQLLLVPVVVFAFGIVQRWLGRIALVAVWVFGHVGATLFVAAMEVNALYRHIAHFSIVVKPDVGVSYGMAAAIGLLCAHVPPRWRLPYGIGCLAVTGAMLAIWPGFTPLGHLTAIVIGLGMAAAVHGGEVASFRPWSAAPSPSRRSLGS
ncbi:MAG TPA: rhomboid-like protein, partial [Microlunatus sp.]|nr:rhomboid-like protein [Microlunatus sp.]